MQTLIALFRGINVGGHHKLPMQELKDILDGLGLSRIQTYIQSGNVVFQTNREDLADLANAITTAVAAGHGFSPNVILLTYAELKAVVKHNPFPDGESEPKTLHCFFLETEASEPDDSLLQSVKAASECYQLNDQVFYLHAPDGIGRSKLAGKVERALGVSTTGRNWRTVTKLLQLAKTLK